MAYVNTQTSMISDEITFFNKFANDITQASEFNHIELINNNIDQEDHSITFRIMDILELKLKIADNRKNNYYLSYNLYNISNTFNSRPLSVGNQYEANDICSRKINYLIIDNPTSILFCLNSYDNTNGFFDNIHVEYVILLFKDDLVVGGNIVDYSSIDSINSFILSDSATAKYYNALNFIHIDDNISICNKILVDDNNRYLTSLNNIYDSSYVTKNSLITVNDKKCFAINEHTLIACE